MIYIYHHLGLGDHFVCNGLVRYYHKKFGQTTLFCKNHLINNIKFMYRDLAAMTILSFPDDSDVQQYIRQNNLQTNTIIIGFDKIRSGKLLSTSFDQAIYEAENIPFSCRFTDFYVERDHEREKNLFDKLIKTDQYIFVHDDHNRGMNIDKTRITSNLPIIRNDTNYLITDYLTILEHAAEIHLMQSCFKDMINSYAMPKPRIFLHNYIRNYDEYANSKGLNAFEVIY